MVMHMDQDRVRRNGHSAQNAHNGHEGQNGNNGHHSHVLPDVEQQAKHVDYNKILELGRELLIAIGEDPDREGLQETPRRWADWWREFIEYDAGKIDTTFEAVSADQMVCVSGMRVFSLCEHHLLPMWCDVSIGYITGDKVLGLSKFARIAHKFAHQLQLQERLGAQIADEVSAITDSQDVAVVIRGEHLCMSSRGIRTPGVMTTSVMRGVFKEKFETRTEFLRLIDTTK
jgi:GTP cyclohydrolase I